MFVFLVVEKKNNKSPQVARKLVLMEQDLERSEEKVELSERFVAVVIFCNNMLFDWL